MYGQNAVDAQTKVTAGLDQLDSPNDSEPPFINHNDPINIVSNRSRNRFRLSRPAMIAVATAAVILIAIALPFNNASRQAMATIQISLEQATKDVSRHYQMVVTHRLTESTTSTSEADLYFLGNQQYAIRKSGPLFGTDLWLGSDQGHAWIVPRIGPVLEGNIVSLSRWLNRNEQLSTPYLHVATLLRRMGDSYDLELLPSTTLQRNDGRSVDCQHIIGTATTKQDPKSPDRIELWADSETGIAQKLLVNWNLKNKIPGRESVIIEYFDQPELPADWFRAEGHYEGFRRHLSFDSGIE